VQTIALVWTLLSELALSYALIIRFTFHATLEQNPYAGPLPVVQKVLIVCPVSLVNVGPHLMTLFTTAHFVYKPELEGRIP
jgi:hypothetical protein